jgi:hypothetical protein
LAEKEGAAMKPDSLKKDIRFAFHILTHPLDGFWDMKREKRGRLYIAVGCIALLIISNIFTAEAKGFLFNPAAFVPVDAFFEAQKILVILAVFVVGNWSVTTLLDGMGTMKDILMTVGYACLPVSLIHIPVAILTNVLTYRESIYVGILQSGAWIWFFCLLFLGIMTIHQYTVSKMALTAAVTVVAMAVIVFVYLLFFSMITQMVTFMLAIYKEITFRM